MGAREKIEMTAHAATIGVAVLLSAALVKVYFLPVQSKANPPAAATTAIGTSLKKRLAGVDWTKNGRTLVLAVSTQCHFCKESSPFYRRLRQEAGTAAKVLAVVPQPIAEAEQYFKTEGVQVDEVKQVRLEGIGVRGTPTMLLVDNKGIVTQVWVGKLADQQQEEVIRTLLKRS